MNENSKQHHCVTVTLSSVTKIFMVIILVTKKMQDIVCVCVCVSNKIDQLTKLIKKLVDPTIAL